MKKIYLFACATLLAFSGCTNEISEDGFVDKTNAISFSAYPTRTRALVAGDVTSENMKDDNFGVFGYFGNSPYLYVLSEVSEESSAKKAVEQKYVASSGSGSSIWEYVNPGDLKFWPNGPMNFYAYFPYSDNATFAGSDASGDVMTIPNVNCSHDVLFAKTYTSYQERVPLIFNHAFSKIKKVEVRIGDDPDRGYVKDAGVSVEIQKVEFINTSTSGTVKVDNSGVASYEVASPNVTLSKDLTSHEVTVNSENLTGTLIDNSTSGGYLFATKSTETNKVKGTGKTMWDGTNTWPEGKTLENLGKVCLKLTCKVWNGTDSKKYYYLGTNTTYGVMYIPLTGTSADPDPINVNTFEAGKRYIYNIVFKNNVGFKSNGDPVLRPILFKVKNVSNWSDVTVTITL